jgi:hypothetical protein
MQANSGVDAGYPEATKLPFPVPPMLIGVRETVDQGFPCSFEKAVADTSMTSRLSEHPLVPSLRRDASLDPAQILSPLRQLTTG